MMTTLNSRLVIKVNSQLGMTHNYLPQLGKPTTNPIINRNLTQVQLKYLPHSQPHHQFKVIHRYQCL